MKHDKLMLDQERRESRKVLQGATQLERLLKCQMRIQEPNSNQIDHDPTSATQRRLNQWLQRQTP